MKIKVKVIPKSSNQKVWYDAEQDLYKVKVMVAPEKGRANERARELLAKHFKLNKINVLIASGKTSEIKIFEIGKDE